MSGQKSPIHGRNHRLRGSDPVEIGLGPSALMGQVMSAAVIANGLAFLSGTLWLPDRDGPALASGETLTIDYSHYDPPAHFSWMAARLHIVSGLEDERYAYLNPWESAPWDGGIGSYASGSFTYHDFVSVVAVTNDDGETVTWSGAIASAEQYGWDPAGIGHIGYVFHDFAAPTTNSLSASFSGSSTQRAGAIQFNSRTGAVTVGDVVAEGTATDTVRLGLTLTEDVPAGSQLILACAAQGPAGFAPGDATNRPNIELRPPDSDLVPKFKIGSQSYPIPVIRL